MHSASRAARLAAVTSAAVVVAGLLAGCGSISSLLGGAERDADTGEVTDGGTESVFDIEVGDCLLEPEAENDEVIDIAVVPCDETHDYEFFYEYDLDLGEEYPGEDAIAEDANAACAGDAFEEFVGVSFDESASLWPTYYYPQPESWKQGDRTIQCLLYESSDDDGAAVVQVEGTLEGSKR